MNDIARRPGYRLRIAAVLVCASAFALDVNWCRSVVPAGFLSRAGYVASTAILLVATVGASIALTPRVAWRALAIVFVLAIGWSAAAVFGAMFAHCDVSMRPYLGDLLLLLITSIMVQSTGIVAIAAFSGVAALVAWRTTKIVGPRISNWLIVGLLAGVPVVFYLMTFALSIGGTHPAPGNCVI